jgi:hypothetical protein
MRSVYNSRLVTLSRPESHRRQMSAGTFTREVGESLKTLSRPESHRRQMSAGTFTREVGEKLRSHAVATTIIEDPDSPTRLDLLRPKKLSLPLGGGTAPSVERILDTNMR